MQDAVPMRLGQEFSAYAVAIAKAHLGIATAADTLRELGLGGSAVGTGINTHPDYRVRAIANLAAISSQHLTPADDMVYAMQSCAPMATISSALRTLALEAIRISNDLRLLSSGPNTGLGEIQCSLHSPAPASCPARSTPSCPNSPPWSASRSSG